jgi:hypothetical protein
MAAKQKTLYLCLTIACFVGLIAIFIVDGYMGVYDTVHVTAGEREQRVEADFWLRSAKWDNGAWNTQANRGDKVFFRYEVDNRRFAAYSADIEAAVWSGPIKQRDLISRQISIDAFDKVELEWVVDTSGLRPSGLPPERSYQFSVIITRGEIERRIIVNVNPIGAPPRPVPLPPPPR